MCNGTFQYDCSEKCSCLTRTPDGKSEYVACDKRNLTVVPFALPSSALEIHMEGNNIGFLGFSLKQEMGTKSLFIQESEIKNISESAFKYFPYLQTLHLENNYLAVLDIKIFEPLTLLENLFLDGNEIHVIFDHRLQNVQMQFLSTLSLHNNELQFISDEVGSWLGHISHLQNLTLANNPWECGDCLWVNWFKDIQHLITDQQLMDCYDMQDSVIMVMKSTCNSVIDSTWMDHMAIISTVGFGALALLIAALCIIYRYRKFMKIILHNSSHVHVSNELGGCCLDAYVLYNAMEPEVHNWVVNVLVARLEMPSASQTPFKLFIPERDSLVGADRMEEIICGIHMCKRTIVIISPKFNDDQWLLYAFTAAHDFTMGNAEHKIIMVIFNQNNIMMTMLSERISLYLRVTSPLVVGETLFWRKLHSKLPASPRREDRPITTGRLQQAAPEGIEETGSEGMALLPIHERFTQQDAQTMHLARFMEVLQQERH